MIDKNTIKIDLERDNLLPKIAIATLRKAYLSKDETSPQHAFARAAAAFADDEAHAQRLYDAASQHWFMFSTPILANGGTNKGLGISCFLQNVEDSIDGLKHHYVESIELTVNGGGLGGYWGNVRTGGKSNGMIPFLKVMDSITAASNQTDTRRGAYAAYLDIDHPDIEEFIEIRDPNGDAARRCLGLGFHHAVVIPNTFMEAVKSGGEWQLIDPHSKEVKKTLKARDLWKKILKMRLKTGEPYLMWKDTVNGNLNPQLYKKGLRVRQSNLCNEIFLPTGIDYHGKNRTAIRCLSSLNTATFDEWKDHAEQLIEDIVRMLDNVITHFIENASDDAEQAKYSAMMTRDIGLGAMGFHQYLQKHMVAYESSRASELNNILFYTINKHAMKASQKIGEEKGFYPDAYDNVLNEQGEVVDRKVVHRARNAHVMAMAPNASSAIVCGNTSPSGELYSANAFKQTNQAGSFLTKNPELEKLLKSKGLDNKKTWDSIIAEDGSVQHLEGLTDDEKLVFKTAFEVDQMWVIEHHALRQPYFCQGQSMNIFLPGDVSAKVLNDVHMSAYDKGLKGAYYLRSKATRSKERLTVVKSRETVKADQVSCSMCEG